MLVDVITRRQRKEFLAQQRLVFDESTGSAFELEEPRVPSERQALSTSPPDSVTAPTSFFQQSSVSLRFLHFNQQNNKRITSSAVSVSVSVSEPVPKSVTVSVFPFPFFVITVILAR